MRLYENPIMAPLFWSRKLMLKRAGIPLSRRHVRFSATSLPCVDMRFFSNEERQMLDVILLVIGLAMFGLTVGYAYACDRL